MIFVIFGVVGLAFGSFVNAWVWRTRQVLDDAGEPKKLNKKEKAEYSILKGRSMCPSCRQSLKALDLIPLFSWLFLAGKCRYCKKPISVQYPIVEFATAVLFVVSYVLLPTGTNWEWVGLFTWLIGLIGLIALAVYDAKWMILPNTILRPIYGLVGAGLVIQFIMGRPLTQIFSILGAIAVCSGLFLILFLISKGRWIGYGDVMLGLLTGALIGSTMSAIFSIFTASVLGMLWSIPLLMVKKVPKNTKIPFGPFLIAGAILAVFFGTDILNWYKELLII
jgi:prepilin signal peptidase PulO-like enzyme (type II secretory pathway)